MKKEWFASWFDSPFYHILYKNRDDEEAQQFISNLIQHIHLKKNAKVMDLACGKGRHARMLHQEGLRVLGVDLSPNSISAAKKIEQDGLSFDVHDMREVYSNEKFEAIFNLFTSFGYFNDESDNIKMLESIHSMLNKDGLLIIDFMNASKVISNLVENEIKTVDDVQFTIKRTYDGKHIFKNISFNDGKQIQQHTERVQAVLLNDFKRLLHLNNFKILSIFGDFDLNHFDEENSDRLIIIAQKTE